MLGTVRRREVAVLATERGFARWLPVEITMANDLPVALIAGPRAHAWFNDVLLYFLDEHAYPPEAIDGAGHTGVWIAGDGRADMIMRSDWRIDHLRMTVESRVPTTFIVSAGGARMTVPLTPDKPVTFDLPASGVRDSHYAYCCRRDRPKVSRNTCGTPNRRTIATLAC